MDVVYRRVWVGVWALVLSVASAVACAAVGRTVGNASVSNTGAAVYSVPLWVPPGINGMQPSLALTYSSRVGNGYFGVGWSLEGLSVIQRCAKTWAQDGVARDVRNDATDRFCLDGQQLKLVGGVYGADGAEYRTEIESFARVRSYGTAGNGPKSFVVEQKSGLILEYGATDDSRIEPVGQSTPHTWALNKVSDRSGNAMLLAYMEDAANGSYTISSIQYAQNNNAAIAPHYEVSFVYEDVLAGEVDAAYFASSKIKRTKRADRIDVKHDGALVRRYELTYEAGLASTSRTRLASLQECAAAADCLAPSRFTYQNGTPGVTAEMSTGLSVPPFSSPWPLDINGDGRRDLVYPSSTESGKGTWIVAFANASGGYSAPINTGISNVNWVGATPIDYNADGLDDLLVPYANGTWWVLLGAATGLNAPVDTAAPLPRTGVDTNTRAIDIDGDGLQDLVWADLYGYTGGDAIRYRLRVLGGTFSSDVTTIVGPLPPEEILSNVFGLGGQPNRSDQQDFNGDGRGDITYQRTVRSRIDGAGTSNYLRAYAVFLPGGPTFGTRMDAASATASFGDFNGDGLDDLLYFKSATNKTYVRFSTGTSLTAEVALPFSEQYGVSYAVVDWDGDGFDDVLIKNRATSEWSVFRSTGEEFALPANTGISGNAIADVVVADVNGDGLSDFAYGMNGSWNVRTHAGVAPDLLISATDGFGVGVSFNYEALTQGSYTRGTEAAFPERDYQGPLYVVKTLSASTGVASPATYAQTFSYSGARFNSQGRGFEGFYSRRVVDSRNGLISQQYFRRDFPYVGIASQIDEMQPDGVTLISRTQNLLGTKAFGSGVESRYFPFVETSLRDKYEVGGARNAEWISHDVVSVNVDDYGTPTRIATATQDKDSQSPASGQSYLKTVTRQINNDAASWCLGRSTQTVFESTLPDGTSASRTEGASVDSAACRIVEQVTEPVSATLRVTTRYGFDVCGNVTTTEIIGKNPDGSDMPTRTSGVDYGSRCQFPLTQINALSETTTQQWDYSLGALVSSADPNGITTSWQYDGIGRLVREDRADATYSTWSPSLCQGAADQCIAQYTVRRDDYGSDGRVFNGQSTFLDAFDRPVGTAHTNAFGAQVERRISYDELGRVASSSAPFFAADGVQHLTMFGYDVIGRMVQESRETSEVDSTRQTQVISHEGLTTRVIDSQGRRSNHVATVLGQLASSTDPEGYGQSFAYDPFGDLTRVQDTLGRTLQANIYNIRGMRTASTDVDMGSWSYVSNSLGENLSLTDANSSTVTFTYDALSRPLSRVEPDGSSTVRYTYQWAPSGKLERAQVAGGTVRDNRQSFQYDSAGRLSEIKYSDLEAGSDYSIDQTYSPITGLLDTLTYPTSTSGYRFKLQYEYQNGQLIRIADFDDASATLWRANASDARGNVVDETLGNGLQSIKKYDAVTGWLDVLETTANNGTSIQSLAYHFDSLGNLIERHDLRQGLSERFYYDTLSRLDYSTLNGVTNLDMAYDESGNVASKSGVGTYAYDAAKIHALTAIDGELLFGYDANGSVVGDPRTFTLSHYSSKLPKSAHWVDGGYTSTFSYGPDQQRFLQLASFPKGSETITYIGGLLEKVAGASGTSWKHYIFTPSGRTALYERRSDGAEETYFFTQDHLGSIDSITDGSGELKVRLSYNAHGGRRKELGWSGALPDDDWQGIYATTHRGFTDHEMLDDLDVIHMNGRLFDPYSGRFLSVDPIVQAPLNTQSFNRYSYVWNNPLSAVDPTGFHGWHPGLQNGHPGTSLGTLVVSGSRLGGGGGAAYAFGGRSTSSSSGASSSSGYTARARSNAAAATSPAKPQIRTGHVVIDCSPGLFICDDSPLKPWTGPQEESLDGLWDDIFFFSESLPRVAAVIGARVVANRMASRAIADGTQGITNAVPRTVARVTSGDTVRTTLGPAGVPDVFVTAADDIAGLNAAQLAQRLTIPANSRFTVVEFPTPAEGLASPVFRTNPGFIGGGLTGGGAREFVIPNGPIPAGATVRIVGP